MMVQKNRGVWDGLAKEYLTRGERNFYNRDPVGGRKKLILLIKRRLFRDVWDRMKRCGEVTYPVLMDWDSRFIREDRRATILPSDDVRLARLIVVNDEFLIQVNDSIFNRSPRFARTLVVHELGHTFLFDTSGPTPVPYFRSGGAPWMSIIKSTYDLYASEEGLAYEIGRHILAPDDLLRELLPSRPSLEAFLHASSELRMTYEYLAWRLYRDIFDRKPGKCYWPETILLFCPRESNSDKYLAPRGIKRVFRGTLFRHNRPRIEQFWQALRGALSRAAREKGEVFRGPDIKTGLGVLRSEILVPDEVHPAFVLLSLELQQKLSRYIQTRS
ncbi:MAG: hypothetical protein ACTSU5_07025 [Promethearchaeota archaeon]